MAKGRFRDGIRPTGPSRWEVVVSWRNPDGTFSQLSRTVAGTRRDAERVRDELRHRRHDRGLGSSDEDFGSVLDEWIDLKERSLSPSTVDVYHQVIRARLGPALGSKKVRRLTARDLDRYYAKLHEEGLAPGTIAKLHSIIRGALEQARRWGIVGSNVADDASPPTNVRRPIVAVPADVVARMLERSEGWFAVLLRIAAVTGARRGEVVGLQWRDVDFDAASITIRRSVVRSKDSVRVVRDTTKTNRHGVVSIDPRTITMLRAWRSRCGEASLACGITLRDESFLFSPDPDGRRPRWPKDVNYEFVRIRRLLGLEGFSFKDATRHFVATQLIASGEDVRTVAGRLRHATPSQTLNTYAHFLPERDRAASTTIGTILDGERGDSRPAAVRQKRRNDPNA